jgi:hypothetical protein
MKQILILLGVFMPVFGFADLKQYLKDRIDETGKEMTKYLVDDDYMENPHWIYLSGVNDTYYEILYHLSRD